MDYIHKLPFILGAMMSIIIGVLNIRMGNNFQDTYVKMAISITVFYIVGMYIRGVARKLAEEQQKKRQELEELEQQSVEEEKPKEGQAAGPAAGPVIDYRVDDGEEFTPLKVSEILNSQLNE